MYLMLNVMVVFRRSLISLMSLPKPAYLMIQMLKAGKDCLTQNSKIPTTYPEPRASPIPALKRKQLINRPKLFKQAQPTTQRFKVRKIHQRRLS
jgi:hypothetical protein